MKLYSWLGFQESPAWSYMNLLIGFVVLLCLLCSEMRAPAAIEDCWTRVLLVGIIALTVPSLALFQTLVVSRRLRAENLGDQQCRSVMRRISVCHSAVWLTASLAIIWAVRWQDVVRVSWDMDRWPLVDEALILAPVMLSLVASWAIFYDVQHSMEGSTGGRFALENIWRRIGYVTLRIRVYFLIMLLPIMIAVLSRDLSPWLEQLTQSQSVAVFLIAGIAMMAGFPFLLLLMWRTKPVENGELSSDLFDTCRQHRIYIHDIRIWKTGNQIVNALVAGVLPRFRVILLSDSLVKLFPKNELLAIVRHEAGHLRLWHLPIRIGFVVLPLIAMAIDEQNPLGLINGLESRVVGMGLPIGFGIAFFVSIYLGYLFFSMSWLSHQMEFEADIYACQAISQKSNPETIDDRNAKDMSDSLLRLASVMPSQFERRTILHPSIRQRLLLIREIQDSPIKAKRYRDSFVRRQRIILLALTAFCFLPILIQV